MTQEEVLKIAKPILFNTDMVRAILDGRKTVTRRVLKLPSYVEQNENGLYTLFAEGTCYENQSMEEIKSYIKPPYNPGDILYVRETWCYIKDIPRWKEYYRIGKPITPNEPVYKADNIKSTGILPVIKWRPSIHMPKEAARIFLKVKDVTVERLQDIMKSPSGANNQVVKEGFTYGCDFVAVWNSTIKKKDLGKYGWDANPWVWVIEFERMKVK